MIRGEMGSPTFTYLGTKVARMAGVKTSSLPLLIVALAVIGCGHEPGADDGSASRGE